MSAKNLILFTGANRVFRERDLAGWIRIFGEKYASDAISRVDAQTATADQLRMQIGSSELFHPVRLVILTGFGATKPANKKHEASEEKHETGDANALESVLEALFETLSESTFIIVHTPALDRRTRF